MAGRLSVITGFGRDKQRHKFIKRCKHSEEAFLSTQEVIFLSLASTNRVFLEEKNSKQGSGMRVKAHYERMFEGF